MGDSETANYNKLYYEQHKDELSRKRRDRYKNDPEYRAKMLAYSREYRNRRKRDAGDSSKPRKPQPVMLTNGTQAEAYSIGHFASRIGRSKATLNAWMKNGMIPDTPFATEGGNRLWTVPMMDAVKQVVEKHGRLRANGPARDEIVSLWQEAGAL